VTNESDQAVSEHDSNSEDSSQPKYYAPFRWFNEHDSHSENLSQPKHYAPFPWFNACGDVVGELL
jgi:hypothetical protein